LKRRRSESAFCLRSHGRTENRRLEDRPAALIKRRSESAFGLERKERPRKNHWKKKTWNTMKT